MRENPRVRRIGERLPPSPGRDRKQIPIDLNPDKIRSTKAQQRWMTRLMKAATNEVVKRPEKIRSVALVILEGETAARAAYRRELAVKANAKQLIDSMRMLYIHSMISDGERTRILNRIVKWATKAGVDLHVTR